MADAEEVKIIFRESEDNKVDLKIRLKYDNLNQTKFFKACLQAYLNRDDMFMRWLNSFIDKTQKISKTQKRVKVRNDKEIKKIDSQFNLNNKEVMDIFDILEKENPNL